jgi:hypothetical protein
MQIIKIYFFKQPLFSPKQQSKMAAYCVNIFGDMLLDKPLDEYPVSYMKFVCYLYVYIQLPCSMGSTRMPTAA